MKRYNKEYFNCPICGRETWGGNTSGYHAVDYVMLKDNRICRDCADELHVMYPVTFKDNLLFRPSEYVERGDNEYYFESSGGDAYHEYSGISELTLDQYKEKLNEVEAYRAQLRRKYDGYGKVFEVLGGSPTERLNPFEVGLPKMLKFKDTIKYSGRAILGTWSVNDMVILIHEGREIRAKILDAKLEVPRYGQVGVLKEGYMGYITLEKGTPMPSLGDLIVSEDY